MALIDVRGVKVSFPYTPYPCQVTYMEKVVETLQKHENAVLESPTGTGKTLCLLCSSLAWLEGRKAQVELNRQTGAAALLGEAGKENISDQTLSAMAASLQRASGSSWGSSDFLVPKIIYASRTHSQLSQAVQELKKTAYSSVKTAVIGSREQLCVNEQVKKEVSNTAKVHLCRAKVSAHRCHHYNVLEDLKRNAEVRHIVGNVVDIEDLVSHGSKSKVCPYYLAREIKSDADIIFMPYNYLLDPKSRRTHGVELQGNIVIFDEAHNLERICEESASFDLSSLDLATAIEETTQLGVKVTDLLEAEAGSADTGDATTIPEFTLEDIVVLKKTLLELEELIDAEPLTDKGSTQPGMYIFDLLAKVNISYQTKTEVINVLDKMVGIFKYDGTSSLLHTKGVGLSKVADALKIVFSQEPGDNVSISQHKAALALNYKVHIHLKEGNTQKRKKKLDSWASAGGSEKSERVLSYWCFSPGHSMKDLVSQGVTSIILTSGTLSPIESFTMEMQVPFNIRLENPHVIQKHQVWIGSLSCGPDGTVLNSSYQNRFSESYQSSLGNSIVNFARVVPKGLLVFFPSYPLMEMCVEMWQKNNIWNRILAHKAVVLEPRGKDAFTEAMQDYYSKINDETLNGAIFMAVCRGKVSEGLDFADTNGRAVVITGLPFPPMMDPRVILKMQHLDSMRGKMGFESLTGQQWYQQQATRAVNQAIGRVIRHKDDFGAILLCDTRFSSQHSINQLPMWIRPYVSKYTTFGQAVKDMLSFFKIAEKTLPVPQGRQHKSKTTGNGSGCQVAFFEPTLSRRVGHIEQASGVAYHVPSLSKQRNEGNSSTISPLEQYTRLSIPKVSSATGSRQGLLGALESSDKIVEKIERLSESQIPSYQPLGKKVSRKRKIVIKWPDSHPAKPPPSVTALDPKDTSSSSSSSSSSKVKSVLSAADYQRFSKALTEYKNKESLPDVTAVLAHLFTTEKERFHLFRMFYKFVRPHHKKEFDSICSALTGQSCNYRSEHVLTWESVMGRSAQESHDKRMKLDSVQNNGPCQEFNSDKNPGSSKTSETGPSSSSNSSGNVAPGSSISGCKVMNSTARVAETSSASTAGPDGTKSSHLNTERHLQEDTGEPQRTTVSLGQLDVEKIRLMARESNKVHPKSGYTCSKCKNDAHVPFENTCGHVCCFMCWRQSLQVSRVCPGGCGQEVRRRQLRQLLFASGDQSVFHDTEMAAVPPPPADRDSNKASPSYV
ncbi:LOW QUALITY PROTEIN: regulator of telomere elongation helicase 1-like [Pomacea canaliculata]|uniref:LOW QUALITY PROTEIN: regulator of telomere elongation helicase 1-like n=1 Tax=Pomacea canaliculata TaxID=400727 RepID=UPI000D734246|nr:LOW QUALITY PROTEIN: regulator of telomere elongation helicase 1-like [Pomacea canaliculata]